ncbi:MAG: hypothetical protein COB60_07775 [Flavobacteriaceae bacterium]|nr:MAG: hypothetical protein COB60_07775 [Flavobacteriaceae bacterium]
MKKTIKFLSIFLILIGSIAPINAQINRTLDTKVADILAQLPTKDLTHSNTLMQQLYDLGNPGILKICDMLVPLGTGDDTQARYAINSISVYSTSKKMTNGATIVENALLRALENSKNTEIKTFLIQRLGHCASDASIPALSKYLSNNALYSPCLTVLTSINSAKASEAIFKSSKKRKGQLQIAHIEALGELKYQPSAIFIEGLANTNNKTLEQKVLKTLAKLATDKSYYIIETAVIKAQYKLDKSEAILSFIDFGKNTTNKKLSKKVVKKLLQHCTANEQLHFRTAALQMLNSNSNKELTTTFIQEFKNRNNTYRGTVLDIAKENLNTKNLSKWIKAYKTSPQDAQIQIVRMLGHIQETVVLKKCILPATQSKHDKVMIAGIKALAYQPKIAALPLLLKLLNKTSDNNKLQAIQSSLLKTVDSDDVQQMAKQLSNSNTKGKIVLINVLAARNASGEFKTITGLLNSDNPMLKEAIYKALPSISGLDNLSQLLTILAASNNPKNIANIQKAIVTVLDKSTSDTHVKQILSAYTSIAKKEKLLPILPVLSNDHALQLVLKSLESDNTKEQLQALNTLNLWRNNDALPNLFKVISRSKKLSLRAKSFEYYLSQVKKSKLPNDQKLLLIKKLMPFHNSIDEQKEIIKTASSIKSFLSLIFVSKYLHLTELKTTASNAAIRIALPSPGKKDGLSGHLVREIVLQGIKNLTGPDSQYIKIDVKEFLDKMSTEKGFVAIFNGKNLDGWKGLVKNPIARGKMTLATLLKEQQKANKQMLRDWFVKDGIIGFKGEGYNNICTIKDYGDFEMLVDWKITHGGDSGIYLRGTPQIQIWDIARTNVGAQVGSGGLYNNQTNKSIPLVVADNPINDWNTFRIKMVGERVTVHLNGVLVTDNVALENYWDRKLPIFTKDAIELQAHGEDLGFRNVFVREISTSNVLLSETEKNAGFKSLFNGNDLDHWIGNKKDYVVENNTILVQPKQGGHGNLYTANEYSNFNFRFEFKLTPGANNGLGIHTPLKGDAAYQGKELQILDNTAAIYANLKPYQYHGSVYGIVAAKRGHLKPLGQWNTEEVIVTSNHIKIILNGTIIVDANIKDATKNGNLDQKEHPGLLRNKGHIAFLGHGSELEFRNIRIKEL